MSISACALAVAVALVAPQFAFASDGVSAPGSTTLPELPIDPLATSSFAKPGPPVQGPAAPPSSPDEGDTATGAPMSRSDLRAADPAAARALAATSGRRVVVESLLDATSTTFVNPDGTLTSHTYSGPVRVVQPGGGWSEIDTLLVPLGDRVGPVMNAGRVTFSSGGDGALARQQVDGGEIGLGWPGALPAPVTVANEARYGGVQPATDLLLHARPSGFEFSLIINERPTLRVPEYRFPLSLPAGWTVVPTQGGALRLLDDAGAERGNVSATLTHGYDVDPMTGEPTQQAYSPTTVEPDATGGLTLVVRPDADFLADPTTVYPVVVDPTVRTNTSFDTYVDSHWSTQAYPSTLDIHAGHYYDSNQNYSANTHGFVGFSTSSYAGKAVSSATLYLYLNHQWACSPSQPTEVWTVSSSPTSTTNWTNKPSMVTKYATLLTSAGDTCGGKRYVSTGVTSLAQSFASKTAATRYVGLRATNETDNYQYHKYASANAGTTVIPYMSVTYSDVPSAPRSPTASPGDTKCTVGWTAPSSNGGDAIDGYKITAYRYGISGAVSSVTVGDVRSYVYTGLSNGHTWAFEIAARNSAGYGPAAKTADCIPSGKPLAPGSVTASSTSTTTSVSWTGAASNGSTVTGYVVKREDLSTVAPQPTTQTNHGASVRSQGPDTAVVGHPYRYTVWAVNANGAGATMTADVTAGMSDDARDVRGTGGDLNVTIRWTNPETDAVTPWVTGYTVKLYSPYNGDQIGSTRTTTASVRQLAFTSTHGVSNGGEYRATVQATGTGRTSSPVWTINMVTAGPANPPRSVVAKGGHLSASVTWVEPSNDGPPLGPTVVSYTITLFEKNTLGGWDNKGAQTVGRDERKHTRESLTNGKTYYFTVVSQTDYNGSSGAVASNEAIGGRPNPPRSVAATAGNASGNVTWQNPDNDGAAAGGPAVTGYRVEIYTYDAENNAAGNFVEAGEVGATVRSYPTTTALDNGQWYYATVVAHSANGDSDAASTTFQPSSVPDAPTRVSAQETPTKTAGKTSATVYFVVGVDGGSAVQYCRIQATDANGVPTGQEATVNGCAGESSGVVGGLNYDTTYRFRVRAVNSATHHDVGNGPGSSAWSALSDPIATGGPGTVAKTMSGAGGPYADRGDGVTYTIKVENPRAKSLRVQGISDPFPAGFDPGAAPVVMTALNGGTPQTCAAAGLTCLITSTQFQVSPFDLASSTNRTFTVHGVLNGNAGTSPPATDGSAERACALAQNVATLDDGYQSVGAAAPSITTCNGGLGNEPWWTFLARPVAATSTADVNVANGNLVVTATDSTPIQGRGHLALVAQRTYNSQDTAQATLPGNIGKGWVLNVGDAGDTGLSAQRITVPTVQDAASRVTSPLGVALVDRDGTRHMFKPRLLPGIDAASAASTTAGLAPRTLAKTGVSTYLCIDVAYDAPPGVHLGLWRYVEVAALPNTTNPCASSSRAATPAPAVVGYAAVRPDRLRTEYDALGRLVSMVDAAGAELRYTYDAVTSRLAAVTETGCTSCRALRFTYATNEVRVRDSAGRMTVYGLAAPAATGPLLRTVTDYPSFDPVTLAPTGTPLATVSYTYQGDTGSCGGSAGQLCTITDENGKVTQVSYDAATSTAPFLGLGRVTSITDRRPEHYQTQFSYSDRTGRHPRTTVTRPASGRPADTANTSRQSVYEPIDQFGRVERLIEGAAGVTASTSLRTTDWTWDGRRTTGTERFCRADTANRTVDHNLCEVRRLGSANSGSSGYATPDEVSTFVYSDTGLTQKSVRTASATTSLVSTTGYWRQWFRADGTVSYGKESVGNAGVVTSASPSAVGAPVLFTLADRYVTVTPSGNATTSITAYQTTYAPDAPNPDAPPASPVAPNRSPSAGSCAATGAATGNTGLTCATVKPHTWSSTATTKHRYDALGAMTSKTLPSGSTYTYSYFQDGDTTLVGNAPAAGWLRSVRDLRGKWVAFGHDQAGNVVRTWDRNATAGASYTETQYPASTSSVPYSETLYATAELTSGSYVPWRFPRIVRDALGNTTELKPDGLGNVLEQKSPRGFTTYVAYDEDGRVTRQLTPANAAANGQPDAPVLYTYDAFGGKATTTSPNQARANAVAGVPAGQRVSERHYYDAAGRPTRTLRVRAYGTTEPGTDPCTNTTGTPSDGALAANALVCPTDVAYDSVDNLVWSRDPAGRATTYYFDAAHRRTHLYTPINDTSPNAVRPLTQTLYDADGNVTVECLPRHVTEGNYSCTTASTGHVTKYSYDPAGRRMRAGSFRYAGGPEIYTELTYDTNGNVTAVRNPNGRTTSYRFDTLDRLDRVTVPRSSGVSYSTYTYYDASGNAVATVAPGDNAAAPYSNARVSAATYDAAHRQIDSVTGLDVTISDPESTDATAGAIRSAVSTKLATGGSSTRTRNVYDVDGNAVATLDPRAFTSTLSPSSTAFMTRRTYDADGRELDKYTARSFDTATSDPNQSSLTGNEAAQCNEAAPPAVAGVPGFPTTTGTRICKSSVAYDANGNVTSQVLPTRTAARTGRTATFAYSPDDLLLSAETSNPAGTETTTDRAVVAQYRYDNVGRITATVDGLGLTTLLSLNPAGNVAQVTQPASSNVPHVTNYRYDANGNLTQSILPRNNGTVTDVTTMSYSADDRLASVSAPGSSPSDFRVTSYDYDNAGNLTWVAPPSANASPRDANNPNGYNTVHEYTYDNLLLSTNAPYLSDGSRRRLTEYGYDPGGRKTSVRTDFTGSSPVTGEPQTFQYHRNDRLYKQTGRGGTTEVTTTYDAAGNTQCWLSGPASQATGCAGLGAPYTKTEADYYADGLLRSVQEHLAGGGYGRTDYSYDGSGSVTARRTASATTSSLTRYANNDAGLPVAMVAEADAGRTTTWRYNKRGDVVSETAPNSTKRTWSYNETTDGALGSTAVEQNGVKLAEWRYTRDEAMRITAQEYTGALVGGGTTSATLSYGYDPAGRVTSFTNGSAPTKTITWDHDDNRLTYGQQTFTYNADDSLATSNAGGLGALTKTMAYDTYGRLTDDGCMTYSYDGLDRMTGVAPNTIQLDTTCSKTSVTYTYDGLDRQVERRETSGDTTRTSALYHDGVGQAPVRETFSGGTGPSALSYILSPRGSARAASVTGGTAPGLFYLADDGTGSVGAVTSSIGALSCAVRYDPFGSPVRNNDNTPPAGGMCYTGSTSIDRFYRGARKDEATGAYQLGSRTYDPAKAGFLTPDTFRAAPGTVNAALGADPLTRNSYSYVNGDPVNLSDPSGHAPADPGGQKVTHGTYDDYCTSAANRQISSYDDCMYGGAETGGFGFTKPGFDRAQVLGRTLIGFVPVVGDALDLIDCAKGAMAKKKNWADTGLACSSAIPVVGGAANAARGAKALDKLNAVNRTSDALQQASATGKGANNLAPTQLSRVTDKTAAHLDDVRDTKRPMDTADAGADASKASVKAKAASESKASTRTRGQGSGKGGSGGGGDAPSPGMINARAVRFTQEDASKTFKDGRSVFDLADEMAAAGRAPESMPPIRIFEEGGNVFSLDNRRLIAGQMADIDMPYVWATADDIASRRMTQVADGTGIFVRMGGWRAWWQPT